MIKMKHLIITSHPSSKGFTHKIAKAFYYKALEKGDEVEIIDLYDEEFKLDFLRFEDISKMPIDDVVLKIQKKISLSDNLVFISPMWWYSCTAIMKNFFDRIITSGFAYKYEGNFLPEKLLVGKSAQIFMTCDGPKIFYLVFGNLAKRFFKMNLNFCGIKVKDYVLLSSKRTRSDNDLDNFLLEVGDKV